MLTCRLRTSTGRHQEILSPAALEFLAVLHRSFNPTRKQLLHRRQLLQAQFDAGALPDFLKETEHIRNDPTWQGPRPMPGLEDRRVEITGPVDRKMVIKCVAPRLSLTSPASVPDSLCLRPPQRAQLGRRDLHGRL